MKIKGLQKFLLITVMLLGLVGCNFPDGETSPTSTQSLPTLTTHPLSNTVTTAPPQPTETTAADINPTASMSTATIQGLNVSNLEVVDSFQAGEPVRLKWSLDQTSFVLIGYQSFKVYAYPSLELLYSSTDQSDEMLIDFSPNGHQYAVTSDQSSVVIKNWQDNSSRTIQTGINFMYGEFSPDGSQIILDQMDEWVGEIYDIETGQKLTLLTGFETAAPVYTLSFGGDGLHAIWQARATIQVSEISTNTLGTAIFHQDFLTSYALSPNGEILATSTSEMEGDAPVPLVFFYEPMKGDLLGTVQLTIPAYSMDFSPDSSLLSVIDGKDLVIITLPEMSEVARFPQTVETINQVLFSPDGTLLTTIGSDQIIKFWKVTK